MFMEEIVTTLAAEAYLFGANDRKFIKSINRRIEYGEALTTRQGFALIRLLQNYPDTRHYLSLKQDQWEELLRDPKWQLPLRPSVWLKNEVRHMGDDIIAFRCTPTKPMETELQDMKALFYSGVRLLRVTRATCLLTVIDFIGRWEFEMDDATEAYLAGALAGREQSASAALYDDKIVVVVPDDTLLASYMSSTLGASSL